VDAGARVTAALPSTNTLSCIFLLFDNDLIPPGLLYFDYPRLFLNDLVPLPEPM